MNEIGQVACLNDQMSRTLLNKISLDVFIHTLAFGMQYKIRKRVKLNQNLEKGEK